MDVGTNVERSSPNPNLTLTCVSPNPNLNPHLNPNSNPKLVKSPDFLHRRYCMLLGVIDKTWLTLQFLRRGQPFPLGLKGLGPEIAFGDH